MSAPQFPAERAYDLLRYARHYLADEGLISQEELNALILAPSSSARRLETYDEMRQEIQGLRAAAAERAKEIAELQESVRLVEFALMRDLTESGESVTAELLAINWIERPEVQRAIGAGQ